MGSTCSRRWPPPAAVSRRPGAVRGGRWPAAPGVRRWSRRGRPGCGADGWSTPPAPARTPWVRGSGGPVRALCTYRFGPVSRHPAVFGVEEQRPAPDRRSTPIRRRNVSTGPPGDVTDAARGLPHRHDVRRSRRRAGRGGRPVDHVTAGDDHRSGGDGQDPAGGRDRRRRRGRLPGVCTWSISLRSRCRRTSRTSWPRRSACRRGAGPAGRWPWRTRCATDGRCSSSTRAGTSRRHVPRWPSVCWMLHRT